MRSITRPLATAGATLLLVLALASCGDDEGGDASDKASDAESSQSTAGSDATEGSPSVDATEPSAGAPSGTIDASTQEFCDGLKDITATVGAVKGEIPTEAEWTAIQESYADLGEIGAPDGTTDRQVEGFEVVVDAVTGLSYAQAKAEFGDAGGDTIPGVTEEENEKANEFFTYAGTLCADSLQ